MKDDVILSWLGNRIKQGRKEKKLSLGALAADCEIDKANLSRIESGKVNITVLTLNKIATRLFGSLQAMFGTEQ
jgi:transcriptional regulator with XRE-family HTH domain